MKRAVQTLVLLLVVASVQNVLTQMWPPIGFFDALMVTTGLLALRLPLPEAVLYGAVAGLAQDGLAGGLIGLHAFSKTAVAALLTSLGTILMVRGPLAEALLIGVATVVEALIVGVLLAFLGWPGSAVTLVVLARGAGTAALCATFLLGGPWVVSSWRRRQARPRISVR